MDKENKELSYWTKELKNLKNIEKFTWDYFDDLSYKEERYMEKVGESYGGKLSDICKDKKILIYAFLVASLKITLSRYSANKNIAIGIPCYSVQYKNNKNKGMINRTLPLSSYIDHEKTYLEYMTYIKNKILECYKNQFYLNSKILLENNLSNDIMKLVPVNICMKGLHDDKCIDYICSSSKNDLSFLFELMEDKSININIIYNVNKITKTTVKTLCESYIVILKEVLNNCSKKIKDIKLLSEQYTNKILFEFNDTKVDYPKDKIIHELFEAQVEKTPDNVAVVFEDKKLTYRELNERANSLAMVLRGNGVKADSIVGIMVERSLEMIVGIMAILKAGGAYLPIDPNYPKERIEYMLKDSGSNILLSKSDLVETIEFDGEFIDLYNEEIFKNNITNLPRINNS
ncbi:AMP-binding protein, partial [Clostridium botulinum]|uniref:AMP-binding protein n=1 Tax=Clostridium botulinum TaxID=1491 RepID=UPI001FD63DF3|nr:AMP-binding protein [Clostridium botulinum]